MFWQVHTFDFVNWDDATYLTENPVVQHGLSWANVGWALTTTHSPYWHPMTWLSHMLDVELFGMNPGAFHVTSLAIHLANTLLLFYLLRRMTGDVGRSAFVAAVFGVHPLHVESVAWLAERKDVLSTFFWMLTVLAYVRYCQRPRWPRYALILIAYACALMAKPMVVTLPLVLLLLDVWPLRRADQPAILEKLPLFVMAAAVSLLTFIVQTRVGAVANLAVLPLSTRIENAIGGYVAYVWKTVWPAHLAAFYPYRLLPPFGLAAAALILIAVTAAVVRLRRSQPALFVGWLWYVITVAPVIGLSQAGEQAMADRFVYVPMIGLLLMAAWVRVTLPVRAKAAAATVLVIALAVSAHAQAAHWQNSLALWEHAARVTDDNYIAYENMGQALREQGQLEAARARYEQALRLAPDNAPNLQAVLFNDLGLVLTREGRRDEAASDFARAVALNPRFAEAHNNYGDALAAAGRFDEAIPHFQQAIAAKPDFTEAEVGLGGALLSLRQGAAAAPHFRRALVLDPGLAEAHNGLGAALAMTGDQAPARLEYEAALRLKPDLPTAHYNLAVLMLGQGDTAGARQHLSSALAIAPDYAPAAQLLNRIGR